MSPVVSKHEFRAPAEVLETERERLNLPEPKLPIQIASAPLLGTWVNCDHQTRSLVRLMIDPKEQEITLHAFGACTPNPCDWGKVDAIVYAESVVTTPAVGFTAIYKFNFEEVVITGHLLKGALMVETYHHFTDNSGRADYFYLDMLTK